MDRNKPRAHHALCSVHHVIHVGSGQAMFWEQRKKIKIATWILPWQLGIFVVLSF
jgi:hypothetical protein